MSMQMTVSEIRCVTRWSAEEEQLVYVVLNGPLGSLTLPKMPVSQAALEYPFGAVFDLVLTWNQEDTPHPRRVATVNQQRAAADMTELPGTSV